MTRFQYGVYVMLVSGCSQVTAPAPGGEKSNQLKMREQLLTGQVVADLSLGADCREGGQGRCRSGQCLHSGLFPDDVYVCSRECVDDEGCPEEWSCLQVPGLGTGFCAAPTLDPKWKHGAPKERGPRPDGGRRLVRDGGGR
jgi:hypothetical protein